MALTSLIYACAICSCEKGSAPETMKRDRAVQKTESMMEQTPVDASIAVEPEGFTKARQDAEMLNSRFLIEEPPYSYYACGYVVLSFPADPETLERNQERYLELQWSEEEFASQLDNSRQLWKRLKEMEGVSNPEELVEVLFDWVQRRAPAGDEAKWKDLFRDGFKEFTAGRLKPPRNSRPVPQ